jgi:hypothetical protein
MRLIGMPAFGKEQPEVLDVALAPAAVTFEHVHQRGRTFLVAATGGGQQPHRVTGFAHQRGFDEVVAQNMPAEGRVRRQRRQRAVFDEGCETQDGVVTPEVRLAALPVVESGHERRPVERLRELHHAAQQRVGGDLLREGLDDADAGIFLHDAHHAGEQSAGHEAVRVEHDHVAVALAPAAAEVADVAALAVDLLAAAAVKDASEGLELAAEFQPGGFLLDPLAGLVGIAEDEKVEILDWPVASRER